MPSLTFRQEIAKIITSIVPEDGGRTYCLISDDCVPENSTDGHHPLPLHYVNDEGIGVEYSRADVLIVREGMIIAQIEIVEVGEEAIEPPMTSRGIGSLQVLRVRVGDKSEGEGAV